jgi:hypothetical protein
LWVVARLNCVGQADVGNLAHVWDSQ